MPMPTTSPASTAAGSNGSRVSSTTNGSPNRAGVAAARTYIHRGVMTDIPNDRSLGLTRCICIERDSSGRLLLGPGFLTRDEGAGNRLADPFEESGGGSRGLLRSAADRDPGVCGRTPRRLIARLLACVGILSRCRKDDGGFRERNSIERFDRDARIVRLRGWCAP